MAGGRCTLVPAKVISMRNSLLGLLALLVLAGVGLAAGSAIAQNGAPSPASRPLPRTVTLESLRVELADACGAKFHPARETLVAALDRAIRLERDPSQRRNLQTDRAVVEGLKAPPCAPQASAATAAGSSPRKVFDALIEELNDSCGDAWSVLRLRSLAALDAALAAERDPEQLRNLTAARMALLRWERPECPFESDVDGSDDDILIWFVASSYFDRDLLASEQARAAGDCRKRAAMLLGAKEALAVMRAMGDSVPSSLARAARLAAEELRPCHETQPAVAAAPAPVAGAGTPPPSDRSAAPASVARPVRNCTAIDRSVETGELTCRCLGQAQTLSVWGSNPYRAQSSICNAAIHAGVLPRSGMGMVRVIPAAGGRATVGRPRNGIEPSNWDYGFDNAFTVAPGGADPDEAPPFDPRHMSGSFDTELGPMTLAEGRGTFGRGNAYTITPTRIAGPVLEAVWEQAGAPLAPCDDGRVRGRLRFVFTSTGFSGLYAKCEDNLNSTWNGTRRGSP
jgi:hypothetical protein